MSRERDREELTIENRIENVVRDIWKTSEEKLVIIEDVLDL